MKSLLMVATLAAIASCASAAEKVHTPGGLRPKECVHKVPGGTRVHRHADGTDHIYYANGKVEHKAACPEYGQVNYAQQAADKRRAQEKQSISAASPAEVEGVLPYSGWTTYTSWYHEKGIGKFTGYWNVPKKPVNQSGYPAPLYTFTALQNIDWVPTPTNDTSLPFDIIQPVMEYYGGYGKSNPGQWSLSSWIVAFNGGNTYSTNELNVEVGEEVFGNMTKTGTNSWFINSVRMNDWKNVSLYLSHDNEQGITRLQRQPWAYTAVECYSCTGCSTYPTNNLVYSNMELWDNDGNKVEAVWEDKVSKYVHWCNEGVKHQGSKLVTYHFQKDTKENSNKLI